MTPAAVLRSVAAVLATGIATGLLAALLVLVLHGTEALLFGPGDAGRTRPLWRRRSCGPPR